jgi:aminoglycoside phosphotransferase (APT) family kinase protein
MVFDILDFLRRRGLISGTTDLTVTPLTGGFWNDNFRVRGAGVDWVVKHHRKEHRESLFPNLPDAEAQALQALRSAGVAPEPVAFSTADDGTPVLVYQYWPGDPWREDVIPVANLLRRLHAVPADHLQGFRSLPVDSEGILNQGDDLLAPIPQDELAIELRSIRPAPADGPSLERPSLVHTDVGAGNLIVGAAGIRLIDWQCPGIGDPAEDVWAFLSPAFQILFGHAPLTQAERNAFLKAYGEAETEARLAHLAPYFAYRIAAYCCLRRHELETHDPALSDRYRRAAIAQIAILSQPERKR